VFSDIVMAGPMDGLALARRLRQLRPELPILLATGYSRAADLRHWRVSHPAQAVRPA